MIGYDNLVYGEAVRGFGNDGVVRKELEEAAWRNTQGKM